MSIEPVAPATFEQNEATIASGLKTFIEVGTALADIRDQRQYREHYDTFEDYCRERWNLGKTHVYRLIEASQVAAEMSPIGDIQNEGQARAIAPVLRDHGPDVAAEVLREAATDGKVTARSITEAAERVTQPAKPVVAVVTDDGEVHNVDEVEVLTEPEWRRRNGYEQTTTDPNPDDLIPADLQFQRDFWRHMKVTHDLLMDMDFPHYFDADMAARLADFVATIATKHDRFTKTQRGLRVVQGGK